MKLDKVSMSIRTNAASYMMNTIIDACTTLMEDCGIFDESTNHDLSREDAQLIYTMLCKAQEIDI